MQGKFVFSRQIQAQAAEAIAQAAEALVRRRDVELEEMGFEHLRIYCQEIEGRLYGFQFYVIAPGADAQRVFDFIRSESGLLDGWAQGRHVYEFKLHPGDVYDNLQTQGIIIGVREGKLDEYVCLHDEQPQIIHDLCYQNGFRKSSIFVVELHRPYLLQFQEFSGREDPALYENETYQEWLRVTGACQQPLAGEKFWKAMENIYQC